MDILHYPFQAISKSTHITVSSFQLLRQTGDSTRFCLVSTATSKQTCLGTLKRIFIETVYSQARRQESVGIFHTYSVASHAAAR